MLKSILAHTAFSDFNMTNQDSLKHISSFSW